MVVSDDATPKPGDLTALASGMSPERREKCNGNLRPPWEPGKSANPGGRPSEAAAFRASMRRLAEKGARRVDKLLDGPLDEETAEAIKTAMGVVEKAGDRGGYLPVDRLVSAETTLMKAAMEALETKGLPPEAQQKVLAELEQRAMDAFGTGEHETPGEGGDDASGD